jgi:hypothetical protein
MLKVLHLPNYPSDDNTLIITYHLEVKVNQLLKLDYIIALTPTIFELNDALSKW